MKDADLEPTERDIEDGAVESRHAKKANRARSVLFGAEVQAPTGRWGFLEAWSRLERSGTVHRFRERVGLSELRTEGLHTI